MELQFEDNEYYLVDENNDTIATTDKILLKEYDGYMKKLSKENCDEIFRVVDVRKLAREYVDSQPDDFQYTSDEYWNSQVDFKNGFNKAMELNKDKLFTEDQMWNMFYFGDSLKIKIKSGNIDNKPMGEIFDDYIQSLQQPTEIEVEIEMVKEVGTKLHDDGREFFMVEGTLPKLDANGCVVLIKK